MTYFAVFLGTLAIILAFSVSKYYYQLPDNLQHLDKYIAACQMVGKETGDVSRRYNEAPLVDESYKESFTEDELVRLDKRTKIISLIIVPAITLVFCGVLVFAAI